ncbi:MAG: anion-transporting ArsA/GET3 family ATPase [Bradymonadia bacterium]|jgi:anion-transporting  ArsA/GET3 family ATPase
MSLLEDSRFIINTGKGGVGKSTISIAQAMALAASGKRVLHMQLNTSDRFGPVLQRATITDTTIEVLPNLFAVNARPPSALREYVEMKLPIGGIYKSVFENRAVGTLLRVMPGLPELLMLGKAFHEERKQSPSGAKLYDHVIVDAPATGHGLFLLQIPQVITRALSSGPMAAETQEMMALLQDPSRTIVNIVTLAEELPATESIELADSLRESLNVRLGYVIANAVLPTHFDAQNRAILYESLEHDRDDNLSAALESARSHERRATSQRRYLELLRDKIDAPLISLPQIVVPRLDRASHGELGRLMLQRCADGGSR